MSCLCVTEGRPEFAPWLVWNYRKQDHSKRELVIVDSSREPWHWPNGDDVRVVRCQHGSSVAEKRNLAIEHARGDAITWFDDDDWQHPRKLSILSYALRPSVVAGGCRGWFVDLEESTARSYMARHGTAIFNSLGIRRELAAQVRFDPDRRRASDTPWTAAVQRIGGAPLLCQEQLFFWLSHRDNLSNPAGSGQPFRSSIEALRRTVGSTDWGDTDDRLNELRDRTAERRTRRTSNAAPICVVITTFNRSQGLHDLLDDLEREAARHKMACLVFDDASTEAYDDVRARLARLGWEYVRAEHNHGKERWWQWWNEILSLVRDFSGSRFVVLQDDIRLCRDFFDRVDHAWRRIDSADIISLFLHADDQGGELGRARWTGFDEVEQDGLIKSGWVDMTAFACERGFFDALGWRLDPVDQRWTDNPLRSSGVGAQISRRLFEQQRGMYRVPQSLVVHTAAPSQMNAAAREFWPHRTTRFVDGELAAVALSGAAVPVRASLASVPHRVAQLEVVVDSLLPQVDELRVYLNGHASVPGFLLHPKIEVARSVTHGDRGDVGKFFWSAEDSGYLLLCDDDIDYPSQYVERLVAGIERNGRDAIVGFHGAQLHANVVDYYRSRRLFHLSQGLAGDTLVDVLGTGVAGFHSSTLTIGVEDFSEPNLSDLYLAIASRRAAVPMVCLERPDGWLRELPNTRVGSIYERATRDETARAAATSLARRLCTLRPPSAHPFPVMAVAPLPSTKADALEEVQVRGPTRSSSLFLPGDDHITFSIRRTGTYYELDLLDAIRALGARGTYVDVGAHFGNHALFFAHECGADHVVAIEPNPFCRSGLQQLIECHHLDDRLTVLPIAIHGTAPRVSLRPLLWNGSSSRGPRLNSGLATVVEDASGSTRAQRLDEALRGWTNVTVVKIDTPRLGCAVLESGLETLRRDRPVLAIEAGAATDQARTASMLQPLDYKCAGTFCWTPMALWVPAESSMPATRDSSRGRTR